MPVRGYNLTPAQHEYLRSKGNASEYLRRLVERDILGQSPTLEATVRGLVERFMGQTPQVARESQPARDQESALAAIKAFMHIDEEA
jgi:hypothetical protein